VSKTTSKGVLNIAYTDEGNIYKGSQTVLYGIYLDEYKA
jgi:hypothetical protein